MGRMSEDQEEHLRRLEAFHLRELERVRSEMHLKGHQQPSLYHESQRKTWARLRALSRGLLFLLLAFAPIARDLLRVALRSLGIDL